MLGKKYFVTEYTKHFKYKELKHALRFVKLYFVTLRISFEKCTEHITTVNRMIQQTFKYPFPELQPAQVSLPTTIILKMLHKKQSVFVLRNT